MTTENVVRVFVGMGSNLGDSPTVLLQAWEMLAEDEGIDCLQISSPYVTAPVDMRSHHWFTNAVGEIHTSLTPQEVLAHLLQLEVTLGRVRDDHAFGYQDRLIDLDLIYYGEMELDEPDLEIPHPHLYTRLFVLMPLAEIAPDFVDPRRGRSVTELEARLRERIKEGKEKHQEISRRKWPQ